MVSEVQSALWKDNIELTKSIFYCLNLNERQIKKTVSILISLGEYSPSAKMFAMVFKDAAIELGLTIPSCNTMLQDECEFLIRQRIVDAGNPPPKEKGFVRGLSHGFYRALTLSQIIESTLKDDYCHEHIQLMESDLRIKNFKKSHSLYNQNSRIGLMAISGICDKVGLIGGNDYSDKFYQNLICTWEPDVYFINRSADKSRIYEARKRAKLAHAELVILPEISLQHTTDIEKLAKRIGDVL